MWKHLMVAAAIVALTGCIGAGEVSEVDTVTALGVAFPQVEGINLEGEEIALPAGFAGQRNLVAVAFEREQQRDVDTWIAEIDDLAAGTPGFRFYEVPAIYEVGAVTRFWINNGMRRGIPDPEARVRTITVYLDRDAFRAALEIPDTKAIHVLLLDTQGRVLWRVAGPASSKALAELKQALSAQ